MSEHTLDNQAIAATLKETTAECDRLRAEVVQLMVRLAGCSVAALGGTSPEQIAKKGDYGYSAAYDDVLHLRQSYDRLREALEIAAQGFDKISATGNIKTAHMISEARGPQAHAALKRQEG